MANPAQKYSVVSKKTLSPLVMASLNFKNEKFIWDQADSYSLRKRNAEKCKNFQNPTTFKGSH